MSAWNGTIIRSLRQRIPNPFAIESIGKHLVAFRLEHQHGYFHTRQSCFVEHYAERGEQNDRFNAGFGGPVPIVEKPQSQAREPKGQAAPCSTGCWQCLIQFLRSGLAPAMTSAV